MQPRDRRSASRVSVPKSGAQGSPEPSRHPILMSLGDFIRAGFRPKTPLARTIVFALCLKFVAIVAMWVLLFSGDARTIVDETVVSRLVGPSTH